MSLYLFAIFFSFFFAKTTIQIRNTKPTYSMYSMISVVVHLHATFSQIYVVCVLSSHYFRKPISNVRNLRKKFTPTRSCIV